MIIKEKTLVLCENFMSMETFTLCNSFLSEAGFNPYKHVVLFVGQSSHVGLHCLLTGISSKKIYENEKLHLRLTDSPKYESEFIQIIRMGKSIRQIWVKIESFSFSWAIFAKRWKTDIHIYIKIHGKYYHGNISVQRKHLRTKVTQVCT